MKRIVFCGYRGTGKTEIGTLVAKGFGVPFLDTDQLIEKNNGRSISDIFDKDGEETFREIERIVIAELPTNDVVISTGGGVVTSPLNIELLRKGSAMVMLCADNDTIERRLSENPRPPLINLSLREEISVMQERRRQNYHAVSDFCFDTSKTTPEEAAGKIIRIFQEGSIQAKDREEACNFFQSYRIPQTNLSRLEKILGSPPEKPQVLILGVAGYPCAHSLGPKLFNALFDEYDISCFYTYFEHPEIREILRITRKIDCKGLSITIPFKQDVLKYLDEVDQAVQQIGAVNTVIFSCGVTRGYNTDWIGIRKPLISKKGSRAVLLGAGGVAAGAAYALADLEMDLTILNRTPEKAKILAERFGCRWGCLGDFNLLHPDIVVNATSVGMQPGNRSLLRVDQLHMGMTIFDLVYTPPITPLIEVARQVGCTTISGTEVFIGQAKEQFKLFFGIEVPEEKIRGLLKN